MNFIFIALNYRNNRESMTLHTVTWSNTYKLITGNWRVKKAIKDICIDDMILDRVFLKILYLILIELNYRNKGRHDAPYHHVVKHMILTGNWWVKQWPLRIFVLLILFQIVYVFGNICLCNVYNNKCVYYVNILRDIKYL